MTKKFLSMLLAAALAVTMLAGCGSGKASETQKTSPEDTPAAETTGTTAKAETTPKADTTGKTGTTEPAEKATVRVAFWGQNMLYGMAPALREAFPDVDFEFIVAHNTTEYYKYLSEHDDMPDIITVRRFSLLDAVELKDTLVDLSTTDLAATYYQNYLQNYTFDDGTVNWIPSVAEVQTIIANKSLFERCGIELPTDYASFVSACEQFEEQGIIPFGNEWNADYGCLETLEGVNAELLQSLEGRKWRQAYESGSTSGLDDTVWPQAFENMENFLQDTYSLGSSVRNMDVYNQEGFNSIRNAMDHGLVAMIRNGGADVAGYNERNEDEYVMLPYFCGNEDESWLLTYPYYQGAINSKSDVDPDLLMEIFEFMFSQKGSEALGIGNNMMSYSTAVTMDTNEGMKTLDPYFESNKVFIRLANNRFFSASYDVVGQMIEGELNAQEAYEAFNAAVSAPAADPVQDITFEKGYEWEFDPEHGSQASSAIMNTLRDSWGVDMAVCYAANISNSIYEGPAASADLKYLFAGNFSSAVKFELTGAEVKELVRNMVEGWDCEVNSQYGYQTETMYVPHENNSLVVSSGFEMQITRDGTSYKLDGITVSGQPLDENATYSMAFCVPGLVYNDTLAAAGIDAARGDKECLSTVIITLTQWLTAGNALAEPSDYITLK